MKEIQNPNYASVMGTDLQFKLKVEAFKKKKNININSVLQSKIEPIKKQKEVSF